MDLGRQRAHTGVWTLPIEGHVKEMLFLLCFLYQTVYKGQTITTLVENGRKNFRALCAISVLLLFNKNF